jgi:hypothetical protein
MMTIGLRGVYFMRRLCNPIRYGFYAVQIVVQKILRRLAILPAAAMFATAPLLWNSGSVFRVAAAAQALFHLLALLGWLLRHTRAGSAHALALPFFFDLTGVAAVAALVRLVRDRQGDAWSPLRHVRVNGGKETS